MRNQNQTGNLSFLSLDLEQEILIALWKSLDRFDSRSSLETRLYSLARNTAKDFRRKNHNARERLSRVGRSYQCPSRRENVDPC